MPPNQNQNLAAYMASVMARVWAQPRFGNPVYLGGDVIIGPSAEETITLKASSSRDLKVETISCSQDGTTPDRMDPWECMTYLKSIKFTSELKTDEYEHVIDGEIPINLLFGRDTEEKVLDLIKRQEDVTFVFRNDDIFHSHRVNLAVRCSFYPPIVTGLKEVPRGDALDE